jgi:hypothetical protein
MFYIPNVGDFMPQLGYFCFNFLRIDRVMHIFEHNSVCTDVIKYTFEVKERKLISILYLVI